MSEGGLQSTEAPVTISSQPDDSGQAKTSLKEKIGVAIGKAKGNIVAKFKESKQVILNKMKAVILQVATGAISEKVSPSICERMDSVNSLQDRLNDFASKIGDTASKLLGTAERLLGPISRLLNIVNVILNIPIPQSVPPGIGIPVSVTTLLSNIRAKVNKLVERITRIVQAIRTLVATLQAALDPAMAVLDKINEVCAFAGAYCEVLNGVDPNEELDPELEDLLNELEDTLADALGLIQSELDGGSSDGFDDAMNDILDIFDEMGQSDLIPDGIKSRLRRRAIEGDFDNSTNPDVAGGDGEDGLIGPDGLPLNTGDATGVAGLPPNSELFTAIDGNVYLLRVQDDPLSPLIAPRRFGTAQLWNDGDPSAVVLTSPETFTPKPRIILDDIKVRLNTQLALL